MTAFVVLLFVLALYTVAAIVSIHDPKPLRKPREWTVGRMIEPHR